MKCVVPGTNIKALARAVHALSKIGDEIYVLPEPKAISFRAVSSTNSAYSDYTFRENYFSYYNYGNTNSSESLQCKVPMRGALAVFKNPGFMDKIIDTCHIKLEPNSEKLIFKLNYKTGVTKTFLLQIIDSEALQAAYSKDGLPNKMTVQPKVLVEALHNFQQTLVEITLDVTPEKIYMRNYVDDTSSVANSTRTQLALTIDEFDTYKIGQSAILTCCLKELRSILSFAEQVIVPIDIIFETAGKPVIFVLKNPAFESNLVLSSLNPVIHNPNDTTMRDRRAAMMKKRGRTVEKRASKKTINRSTTASTSTSVQSIMSKDSANSHSISTTASSRLSKNGKRQTEKDNEQVLAAGLRSTRLDDRELRSVRDEVRTSTAKAAAEAALAASRRPSTIVPESLSIGSSSTQSRSFLVPPSDSQQSSNIGVSTPRVISLARRSVSSLGAGSANNNNDDDDEDDDFEDTVPNSPPPAKKARTIFRKCLQETFDPRILPGHDEILAEDSDEET